MQPQPIETPDRPPVEPIAVRNGVLVLTGYGLDIRVERGQLQVRDGIGRHRREGRIHRATGRLRRVVVLGHTGTITLDAIRWLADIGAGYVQIDRDGRVLAAFGPTGTDRPALRRAQARAMGEPAGNAIGKAILRAKLSGQVETLRHLGATLTVDSAVEEVVTNLAEALAYTDDIPGMRMVEARAAAAYWGAWSSLPVRFAHRDRSRIPDHWHTFGSRTSALTGGPRLATNPANALLGYLYAVLEGEATIAARLVGLDPGLGVVHADQMNRDSLSADLMEPVRPVVDRFVVDLLAGRTFAARDFFETREGVCRIMPSLARELAQTGPTWFGLVGQVAEDVAEMLEQRPTRSSALPTPISGRQRSAARPTRSSTTSTRGPRVVRTCTACGGTLPSSSRRTCSDECEGTSRAAQDTSGWTTSGHRRLAELRSSGVDPARAPEAISKLRASQSRRRQEAHAWDLANERPDDRDYRERILPRVRQMTVGDIVRATGLSRGHAGRVRRGDAIPHPRWWRALRVATVTEA